MLLIKAQNLSKLLSQSEKHRRRMEQLAREHEQKEATAAAERARDVSAYAYGGGDEGAAAGAQGAKLAFVEDGDEPAPSDGKQSRKPSGSMQAHKTRHAALSEPDEEGMQQIREDSGNTRRV